MARRALLLLSFGGPEGPDEVMPFLRNVVRGRGVPDERLAAVAEHYLHFGGVSPINAQCRALLAAVEADFARAGLDLPVYWGNRNWRPFLADALRSMRDDGIEEALVLTTSAFPSYSGCRQYLEDLERAAAEVDGAPALRKLRNFWNHPGFLEASIDRVRAAFAELPEAERSGARLLFTAHSVPLSMARTSRYEATLREACRFVAEALGRADFELVWQSRSGPPQVPWLEPDVCDHLAATADARAVVLVPIGFTSDHLEVAWDLDVEAAAAAEQAGVRLVRAGTVGTHPRFVAAVRDLVLELDGPERSVGGLLPVEADRCAKDCCPRPAPPVGRPGAPSGRPS